MPITRVVVALLCAVLVSTVGAAAQERKATERPELPPPPGREHFQLKFGAGYDQGDFGTNDTTRSVYAPVTFRYLGERFDVGVTASLLYLDTESSVVVIDGQPTQPDRPRRSRDAGCGHISFKGRHYVLAEPRPESFVPGRAAVLKGKAATADGV